jgi:hypothetical protein
MTRNKTRAYSMTAALLLCGACLVSFSPRTNAQTAQQFPDPAEKVIKARFEVLHMMYQSIQVRSLTDMKELHTFRYAPEIRDQMQNIFNAGGYQYGDKIEVWYQRGKSVALKIKGKPSKPH